MCVSKPYREDGETMWRGIQRREKTKGDNSSDEEMNKSSKKTFSSRTLWMPQFQSNIG
jgi:hypothetical protein